MTSALGLRISGSTVWNMWRRRCASTHWAWRDSSRAQRSVHQPDGVLSGKETTLGANAFPMISGDFVREV